MERRLAAIMSTDVVGYSRLMEMDEEGTLARMKAHRHELWSPSIERHGGRIVGTAGDALLVEFFSAVSAVASAIEVQDAMASREASQLDDRKMLLRIGVNIGEVAVEGDDIFGDGVNVAARLQALAAPGGICISGKVHDEIDGKLTATFADAGEQEVKNISRPVRVWRWSPATPSSEVGTTDAPLALPGKPSIAVLPFDNMSGDPEQEYFSDGITEDIITALSKNHWLFVIARNSTFTYKGSGADVARVSRELGVRYVLEGSVRRAGQRVRITAQLIDGTTANHIWADRFDRELDDIFALQDEITETIVSRIDTEVRTSEQDRARRKPPASLDAWDLCQQGYWHCNKATEADIEQARVVFAQAVERHPNFAMSHAGLALVQFIRVFLGSADDPTASLEQGLAAGEKAVALDDQDAFCHYVLGRVLTLAGQGERSIAVLERSIALNPNFALAHFGLGFSMTWFGRAAEAILLCDTAMRLSPQDPMLWAMQTTRAGACFYLDDYEGAGEWARRAANTRGDQIWPCLLLACANTGLGRSDEVARAIGQARRIRPDLTLSAVKNLIPPGDPDYLDKLYDALATAGLPA